MNFEFLTGVLSSTDSDNMSSYDIYKAGVVTKDELQDFKFPEEFVISGLSKIENQAQTSMCVAMAASTMLESTKLTNDSSIEFSPAFIYCNRSDDDWLGDGMFMDQALNNIRKHGCCELSRFNEIDDYNSLMSIFDARYDELIENAKNYKIKSFYKLSALDEIKYTLMHVGAVATCMRIHETVLDENNYFSNEGSELGGHEVVIIGWTKDDALIIQNSWGSDWGDDGLAYYKLGTYAEPDDWCWACVGENSEYEVLSNSKSNIATIVVSAFATIVQFITSIFNRK